MRQREIAYALVKLLISPTLPLGRAATRWQLVPYSVVSMDIISKTSVAAANEVTSAWS